MPAASHSRRTGESGEKVEVKPAARRKARPFRTVLVFLVLLPMVPVLGLAIYWNFAERHSEKALVSERVTYFAKLVAANEAGYVKNAEQQLGTLAEFPFLVLGTNSAVSAMHFSNLLKLSPDYLNFGVLETNGTVFTSAIVPDGKVNLEDRSYLQRVRSTGRFAIGDYQVGRLSKEPDLNFGYPVRDPAGGGVIRILFSSLKLHLLADAAARVQLPPEAVVVIFDRTGTILARLPDNAKWSGRSIREKPLARGAFKRGETLLEETGVDGVHRIYGISTVADATGPSMYIAVGMPTEVLFAGTNRVMVKSIAALILITAGALLLSRMVSVRLLVRPLSSLTDAAHTIAEGDLKTRAPENEFTAELDELAASFNVMAARLQERDASLQSANERITAMNQELEAKVRERTAQLAAINDELEAFSYSVSHDLRAPLRHLDGFAQLVLKQQHERLDDKGKRHLDVIAQAAKKMGVLIDELLQFSRTGKQTMRKTAVDFDLLAKEVSTELTAQAKREIQWVIGPLGTANADLAMIRQVLVNLFSNAIKYSSKKEAPRIEAGAMDPPESGERVFFVRDNGAGFDMKFANKLFGVFQRLHSDAEFEGTGIGLANVRRIVNRHGGRTWAEAVPGEGATFYFSLPRDESKQ